jgi:hypothetical protein
MSSIRKRLGNTQSQMARIAAKSTMLISRQSIFKAKFCKCCTSNIIMVAKKSSHKKKSSQRGDIIGSTPILCTKLGTSRLLRMSTRLMNLHSPLETDTYKSDENEISLDENMDLMDQSRSLVALIITRIVKNANTFRRGEDLFAHVYQIRKYTMLFIARLTLRNIDIREGPARCTSRHYTKQSMMTKATSDIFGLRPPAAAVICIIIPAKVLVLPCLMTKHVQCSRFFACRSPPPLLQSMYAS